MVICRFFLQGNCKFGDRCWYEHTDPQFAIKYFVHVKKYREDCGLLEPEIEEEGVLALINEAATQPEQMSEERRRELEQPSSIINGSTASGNGENDYYQEKRFGFEHYNKYHYISPDLPTPKATTPSSSNLKSNYVNFSFNKALVDEAKSNQFAALTGPTKPINSASKEFGKEEIESIKDDIITWIEGHQWPFSCYAPRHRDCLSGFEDISPEEMRWKSYEAEQSGTLHLYLEDVNQSMRQVNIRRDELKNATPQILMTLKKVNDREYKSELKPNSNIQSALARTSFKLPETSSVSGSPQTSTTKFWNSENSFKFGFSNIQEQPKSNFQLSQFKSEDTNQNQNNKPFSFTLPSENQVKTPVLPFGISSISSAFSNSTAVSNINNNRIQDTIESETQLKRNIDTDYTALKAITKSEKEQFMAMKFTLGKIPVKPPPLELCF